MIKKIISIDQALNEESCSLAIGFFDGLHLGHKLLIDKVKESKYKKAVLTFSSDLLSDVKTKDKALLLTQDEKDQMLDSLGIDIEYILPFDKKTMSTSKEDFLSFLQRLNVKEIVVGDDFTFARNAVGKANDLLLLEEEGIKVSIVSLMRENGEKISSTLIRKLLSEKQIEEANNRLGYQFFYQGEVIHGFHNGSTISFPTANMLFETGKLRLPSGVYKTETVIDGKTYKSMTNIGNHPTIDELNRDVIETNIINEDFDLYGKTIKVNFISFIREQKRFNSLEELKAQLLIDKDKCR